MKNAIFRANVWLTRLGDPPGYLQEHAPLLLLLSRAIYGHVDGNPNEVCFLDSGSGGPEEFASRVDDAQYLYGLRKSVVCVRV